MAPSADRSQHPFVSLHVRLGPRLMSYLLRRVSDTETAADLWAECWARAYQNWSQRYSEDDAVAEAWVFGIARNLLASYYRTGEVKLKALKRLRWTVPPVEAALDDELERVVDREALRSACAEALQTLPPMRRRAVRLRIIDGLDYRDVADRLGCSEQAARAHVSRGLKRLEDTLDRNALTIEEGANS
jgi:RNA polymerase sigma factor (sigma-70 family)